MKSRKVLYPHLPKKWEPLYPHMPRRKVTGTDAKEISIARDTTAYAIEPGHPALPPDVRFPVKYHEVKAVIDNIGHITYTCYPSLRIGHIEMVNVEPHYRKQGFGSKLVQFAIDDMRKKGIVKISASILSKEGLRLLKAHGFSFVDDLMEKLC